MVIHLSCTMVGCHVCFKAKEFVARLFVHYIDLMTYVMRKVRVGVGTNHPMDVIEYRKGQIGCQLLIPEFINYNMNFKNEKK